MSNVWTYVVGSEGVRRLREVRQAKPCPLQLLKLCLVEEKMTTHNHCIEKSRLMYWWACQVTQARDKQLSGVFNIFKIWFLGTNFFNFAQNVGQ